MIYPEFLLENGVIGVTAPSDGVVNELKKRRFENAQKQLSQRNIEVVMSDNVFLADYRGCSSDAKTRAEEFNKMISDKTTDVILSAAGGNYMLEMLPYTDFENVRKNPKWFQGYSDNTCLLYAITTLCDVASIYGCNFGDFGMKEWEKPVENSLKMLCNNLEVQNSFDYYENEFHDSITGLEGYYKDKPVKWKNARGEDVIEVSGRMIGGCLDVIMFLAGTRFDGTKNFIEKYKDDGILWYLESFDINVEEMTLCLWKLKELGYFKYAKGFVFGRPLFANSWSEITYEEAVMHVLEELNVPVIFDADIGHKGPQFSIVNGAVGKFVSKDGKGTLTTMFK